MEILVSGKVFFKTNFEGVIEQAKQFYEAARKERDDSYLKLRKSWENFKIVCWHLFKDNDEYLKILNLKPKKKRIGKKKMKTIKK